MTGLRMVVAAILAGLTGLAQQAEATPDTARKAEEAQLLARMAEVRPLIEPKAERPKARGLTRLVQWYNWNNWNNWPNWVNQWDNGWRNY